MYNYRGFGFLMSHPRCGNHRKLGRLRRGLQKPDQGWCEHICGKNISGEARGGKELLNENESVPSKASKLESRR